MKCRSIIVAVVRYEERVDRRRLAARRIQLDRRHVLLHAWYGTAPDLHHAK
jgi:hypothetical protein